jgi:hypothetical protein
MVKLKRVELRLRPNLVQEIEARAAAVDLTTAAYLRFIVANHAAICEQATKAALNKGIAEIGASAAA